MANVSMPDNAKSAREWGRAFNYVASVLNEHRGVEGYYDSTTITESSCLTSSIYSTPTRDYDDFNDYIALSDTFASSTVPSKLLW